MELLIYIYRYLFDNVRIKCCYDYQSAHFWKNLDKNQSIHEKIENCILLENNKVQ